MIVKVEKPEKICYLESSDIHEMNPGIRNVVESFADVHEKQKDDNVKISSKRSTMDN